MPALLGRSEDLRALFAAPVHAAASEAHALLAMVKTERNVDLQGYLRDWLARGPKVRGNVRVAIDVDPQSFL